MAERQIYLVRHGLAEDVSESGADFDRALTPTGVRKMEAAALGLRAIGVQPARVITSPYRRAQETAAVLTAARPTTSATWTEPPRGALMARSSCRWRRAWPGP